MEIEHISRENWLDIITFFIDKKQLEIGINDIFFLTR